MHYKTGFCFTGSDLLSNYDYKSKVSAKKSIYRGKYHCEDKKEFCLMILLYCWYLILLDIIENNATFVLPTNSCYAEVRAEPVKGEDFRRAYAAGKFRGIDYFESDFTGYRLAYNFRTRKGSNRRKDIYINQKMKDLFYEKINNGKKYY